MVSVAVVIYAVVFGVAPAGATASGTWRSQHVPRPPGHIAYLNSVSCWSAGSCVAVGTSFENGVQYTMAEHWNRGGWAIQPTPNPAGPTATLTSVSCPSAAGCIAVGIHSPAGIGGEHLLAERWNGVSWTLQSAPEPAGASESELYALSCGSAASCTAVGQYFASGGSELPLVEHWNGTAWTVQHVPFVKDADGLLGGVSCPTATNCEAVGSYGTFNQNSNLFAEHWNGTQWTFQTVPTPGGTSFLLNSVSCPQPEHCTAVGLAENDTQVVGSIVARTNGSAWTLQKDATPAGTELYGVSCASAQSCTAVGANAANAAFFNTGIAEYWNGTRWALQATPVPQTNTHGAALSGISCATLTACTAVGVYGHPGDRPLADHKG
jgi:hypothetical protein